MRIRPLFCAFALLLSGCATATRQVSLGSLVQIRLDTPEGYGHPVTGYFRGATRDSLLVQRDSLGATTAVPRSQVLSLEVGSHGTAKTLGALIGAAAGVAAVVAWAPVGEDKQRCEKQVGDLCGIFFEWFYATAAAHYVIGAGLGAAIGGLVGNAIPVIHWRRVPLEDLRVTVVPLPGGRAGFGAAFSF